MPEDIEFKGEQYSFYNGNYTYSDENNCDRWLFDDLYNVSNILNDEVKVIEEQQDIDIQSIEEFSSEYTMNNVEFQLQDKINQILLAVKQLDRKVNRREEDKNERKM